MVSPLLAKRRPLSWWRRLGRAITSTTGRLALSYLSLIMALSIGYSIVLYAASAHELRRQVPPPQRYQQQAADGNDFDDRSAPPSQVRAFLEQRAAEGRRRLVINLVVLNAVTLVVGSGFSYYLARRTLHPIEANMEAQSQFVSDASHELRTPLTAMQTSNEVALRNRNLNLASARSVLRDNIEEVGKLQALTDGLLQLARQETSPLPLVAVSLQDVASEAINRIVSQAQVRRMSVQDTVPPLPVRGHAASLTQAVVVLLDNAIKYSPEATAIRLSGGRVGKQAYIRVADRGPGIRPADQRRVFERFYRADQSRSSQRVSGHGIGLSLAKKIVDQHDGTIKVTSQVGKGSVFTIMLPLDETASARPARKR